MEEKLLSKIKIWKKNIYLRRILHNLGGKGKNNQRVLTNVNKQRCSSKFQPLGQAPAKRWTRIAGFLTPIARLIFNFRRCKTGRLIRIVIINN